MHADVAPRFGIHDALEQRAEDRGRYRTPVALRAQGALLQVVVDHCFVGARPARDFYS